VVQDVPVDTPAERAGLRPYDVILRADGADVRSDEELLRHVASRAPGTAASLDVLRTGNRLKMTVKLAERPIPAASQRRSQRTEVRPAAEREQDPLGLAVRALDASSALRRALPESVQGVVVVDVDPAGPARVARLRPGQIVLEINRQPTLTVAAFHAAVKGIALGGAAAVLVYDPVADQRVLVAIVRDRKE
jgi:serine protease Do